MIHRPQQDHYTAPHRNGKRDPDHLSQNPRLNRMLQSVLEEVRGYAEDQIKHIQELTKIGLALSAEKKINKLLEMIVDQARALSNADAGTLYILDDDGQHLRFEILQNDSMGTRMGGTSGDTIDLPKVPLFADGRPNYANVSSYTALTGQIVNIPDVYEAEGFDFTGPRKYDAASGYRSTSMLVIPMKNHENDIIGVLQLLNAQDRENGDVVAFSPEYVDLIGSLASQAAVALTNAQLIQDLKSLFYAFIQSIATAIDAKSPYTKGHIDRVVDLTMMIVEAVNDSDQGPFRNVHMDEEAVEELRIAAWMHDVGKITTPEYVVNKSTKLETLFDRVGLIETRFQVIARDVETRYLRRKIDLLAGGDADTEALAALDRAMADALATVDEEFETVRACNHPGEFLSDDKIERLQAIAAKTYSAGNGQQPYLTEDELKNLCIRKGSLTAEERRVIEHHATMTMKILDQLPFPKKLGRVPEYACGHHEKLDGSGYPQGLNKDKLSLQSRIMAIADIFEALTARDRPYKKPMKLSQAVRIMGFMKKDNHIDPDLYDLFIGSRLYMNYARKQMNPDQVDEPAT
jgi:HD-GYP domain-containing protein (c-di-GMP phosphodiesterase class II)